MNISFFRNRAFRARFARIPLLGCARLALFGAAVFLANPTAALSTNDFFGIRVVDSETGRGVPLVELSTVNQMRFYTDSGGWVALHEPGLFGQRVFFSIQSHGYEFAKDGFGFAGKALEFQPGERVTVPLKRVNLAERLYRVTGEGIYRDSALLGEPTPTAEPLGAGKVAGQDSVFGEIYQGKIWWFWGDTAPMRYPLGHYHMACATSDLPGKGGLDPVRGVNLKYLVDKDGFSRPVARLGVKTGLIWADGFMPLRDSAGNERLVCHYAHMESLHKMLGHGLAVFDDSRQEFDRVKELDMDLLWRWPAQSHPIRYREKGAEYIYTGCVFPNVRVRASWDHYFDPSQYEGFTCLQEGDGETTVARDEDDRPLYRWVKGAKPVDGATEQRLIKAGRLKSNEAHFFPTDVESGKHVLMHRGSVRWNEHRRRWIMVAGEIGGTSNLGEIWYAECESPIGPWRKARKIVTHDVYSFYNPVHHPFFDQDGGRWIYFEGTYTREFSGNKSPTPRYDYNQIMYRLDVDLAAKGLDNR